MDPSTPRFALVDQLEKDYQVYTRDLGSDRGDEQACYAQYPRDAVNNWTCCEAHREFKRRVGALTARAAAILSFEESGHNPLSGNWWEAVGKPDWRTSFNLHRARKPTKEPYRSPFDNQIK